LEDCVRLATPFGVASGAIVAAVEAAGEHSLRLGM
jgi:hypothetical protein